MTEDLRPRPVPAPAPGPTQLPPERLPGDGRLPLASGQVHMTDYTRRQLESVGWKDGDPVPGDLGQRLKALQAAAQEEANVRIQDTEMAANWKPPTAKFVDIESLPPEKQAEIRQYLQEYKVETARQQQVDQQMSQANAQIPDSIQGAQREAMLQQMVDGDATMASRQASVVVDDRPPAADPSRTQPAEDTGADHATTCARCSWPVNVPFEIVPTEADKKVFLVALLGLGRFEKRYDRLGGHLHVYFRSLTSRESIILQEQLGAMVRNGESRGDAEYYANMVEFRLAMSVSRLVAGGNTVYSVESLEEWAAKHPPLASEQIQPTPIPRLRDYFYANGATQEPIRRILGETFKEFQQLVGLLEDKTSEPDFWSGIELRA